MTNIKPLIELTELKANIIGDVDLMKKSKSFQINYDEELDFLDVKFINITSLTIVHYVDEEFGVLYDPTTMEIVGLHFEDFKKNVIRKNPEIAKTWYFQESCPPGASFIDLQNSFTNRSAELGNQLFTMTKSRMKEFA